MKEQKKLILIDGHALAYRMFFALERTGMKTSKNQPTWALYGFLKALTDILKKIKPDAMIVSFDMSRKTFRTEEFEEYKAQRAAMPDALRAQMQAIIEGVQAFNIPVFMMENFEADDIIGTIATRAKTLGHKSYILTGDQDSFQLIDKEEFIKVLIPHKNELIEYNTQKVFEKLAVYPEQIVDYKALRGDVSDNIPGVKGIGEKTASKLLQEYKTLDNIYANLDNITSKSVKEKLENDKEMAYKSQFLACIKKDVELDIDFEAAKLNIPDVQKLREFFTKFELHSFLKNLTSIVELFNGKDLVPVLAGQNTLPLNVEQNIQPTQLNLFGMNIEDKPSDITFSKELIDTKEKLQNFLEIAKTNQVISFSIAIDNEVDSVNAPFRGIAFALCDSFDIQNNRLHLKNTNSDIKTFFIPVEQAEKKFFETTELCELIKPIIENPNVFKITHDSKFAAHILKNAGIDLKSVIFDTMLADYIKNSTLKHTLKIQALSYLTYEISDETDLLGKGKSAIKFNALNIDTAIKAMTDNVFAISALAKYYTDNLSDKELTLLYDMELPLSSVLYEMERIGVSIDTTYIKSLSTQLSETICKLENKIYGLAGVRFNINSPKQVGEVLFETLGITPKGKNKTKTGYSTSAEVLEELAKEHEIVKMIIEHRHLNKIKSTYVDTLPELVNPSDNRIHTTYNQTITSTGRLSSSNPNLQNIPARTEVGSAIRGAFVPKDTENSVLLSADYSQIELRLLAHYSKDEVLTRAFCNNEDIHSITAAKIFGVNIDEITSDMRRKAKAVNFGIIYGQTRYGLAEALGITPAEAQIFIDKYFETYPNIRKYMEETKFSAYQNGYVETLYGRKRYFSNELNSSNRNIREFAQRAAINAPLQGTAADLIKLAMIKLNKVLKTECNSAKIILQVHDELILEVPEKFVKQAAQLTINAMELSQPLRVPLVVDVEYGKNWKDMINNL